MSDSPFVWISTSIETNKKTAASNPCSQPNMAPDFAARQYKTEFPINELTRVGFDSIHKHGRTPHTLFPPVCTSPSCACRMPKLPVAKKPRQIPRQTLSTISSWIQIAPLTIPKMTRSTLTVNRSRVENLAKKNTSSQIVLL